MLRSFHVPTEHNKKRVSLRIPKNMHTDIITILLKTGKNTRDFSSWISDAIINLADDPNYHDIIKEELLDRGQNISRPISLSLEATQKLDIMKKNITENHNLGTDISSKIIRTAVTQKLIKEEFLL